MSTEDARVKFVPISPDGWPSCRGRGGLVASHIPTLVEEKAGEARSLPEVCRGSVMSAMMGDTPSGAVARRTCPSRVGHFRVS